MSTKNNNKKQRRKYGFLFERIIANYLYKKGYAVIRSPASGGAKKRPEPDLVIFKNGKAIGIELAVRSEDRGYEVNIKRALKMKEFIERSGIEVYICVKYRDEPIKCISYQYVLNELKQRNIRYITVPSWKFRKEGIKLLELLRMKLQPS